MRISTRGRYALRTLIDLTQHQEEGPVPLKDVAARQGISLKYLEQLVTVMTRVGFIRGVRGPQGGYRLVRAPEDYSVAEILQVMEGSLAPVNCLETEQNPCEQCGSCTTLDLWEGLYRTVTDYLSGISLQSLVDNASASGDPYPIWKKHRP